MRRSWSAPVAILALVVGQLFAPWGPATAQAATTTSPAVLSVSAGYDFTCAIRSDQALRCWGVDDVGQTEAPTGTFKSVSAGGGHACAIRTDDTVVCWGANDDGEATPPGGTFESVSAASNFTCGIQAGGSLACWGLNVAGMATPPDGTFSELDAESWYACAVRTTGALVCWGQPPGDVAWDAHGISAGAAHTCVFRSDGELSCWGNNDWGQLFPAAFQTFTAVSAGWMHTCGIQSDQTLACWGLNDDGQASPPDGEYTAISAGETHSCGIRTDGTLSCWGSNDYGESATAGTAVMSPLPTFASTSSVAVHWGARPNLADVATYDVRYRRAPRNAGFGAYATWLSATSLTSRTFSASAGYTYCYSVRVRDVDDHLSGWTADRCTAVPLDDRSVTRSSGWTAGTGAAYYRSTYLRSSRLGARLTRTGVAAKRIALLATTCPTCGSVKVYLGSTLLKTVSLRSATTVNRKAITVVSWSTVHTGTLKVQISSSGKKVIIDGIAIRRN